MPRYKPVERNGLFIPVVPEEQIQPRFGRPRGTKQQRGECS